MRIKSGTIDLSVGSTKVGDMLIVNGAGTQNLLAFALPKPGEVRSTDQIDIGQIAQKAGLDLDASMQGAAIYVV